MYVTKLQLRTKIIYGHASKKKKNRKTISTIGLLDINMLIGILCVGSHSHVNITSSINYSTIGCTSDSTKYFIRVMGLNFPQVVCMVK